jgi:hypothetical protein
MEIELPHFSIVLLLKEEEEIASFLSRMKKMSFNICQTG